MFEKIKLSIESSEQKRESNIKAIIVFFAKFAQTTKIKLKNIFLMASRILFNKIFKDKIENSMINVK
jgi:hypothetical protein